MSQRGSQWWRAICISTLMPLVTLLLFAGVVLLRTTLINVPTPGSRRLLAVTSPGVPMSREQLMERVRRFSEAIRINTVTYSAQKQETGALLRFHEFLKDSFPLVHNCSFVRRDVVNRYSLLYTVRGANNGDRLPYLMAAHMDVVPADPSTWDVDPFSGAIVNDTYIYGRGTIDNKIGVMGIMEAMEYLIARGERPERDFFIAFGHDEEVGGKEGAQEVMKELRRRGVEQLDFVVDEGFPVLRGIIPGIVKPISLLGVVEKGYATLELSVTQEPGHSSFPPRHSAIGILAAAITRLEHQQHPCMFGLGPELEFLRVLSNEMSFLYRAVLSNLWLFSNLVSSAMERDPQLNAMIRTTTAVTVIQGGNKDNVLPGSARALVNHRIHPQQSVNDVVEFDRRVINDPRVSIKVLESRSPLRMTPHGPDDIPYQLVAATVHQVFQDVIVAPGMLVANTDTRWYLNLTDHAFRFGPVLLKPHEIARIHGNNEHLSVDDLRTAVEFYYRLVRNADQLSALPQQMHFTDEL